MRRAFARACVLVTLAAWTGCDRSPPPGAGEVRVAHVVPADAAAEARIDATIDAREPTIRPTDPVRPLPRVATIYGGPRTQCLILEDGCVQCWGYGRDGALGTEKPFDRWYPTLVAGLTDVIQLALGETSTCALTRDGSVSCWGSNEHGQLGDGTKTAHFAPAPVPGLTSVTQIVSGAAHVCARLADGSARCWGGNDEGQLGDGSNVERSSPVVVTGLHDAAQLAVGAGHSCARLTGGTVMCWGDNAMAQLGRPGLSFRRTVSRPAAVPHLADVVDLVSGLNHNCVRTRTGVVSCWGWDEECQLGSPSAERCIAGTPCRAAPTPIAELTDVVELALSAMHSCARRSDGSVACWGDDPHAIGADNSTRADMPHVCKPAPVTALAAAAQISTFWGGACALLTDNAIWCWGTNWFGELGDGTTTGRPTPAVVKRW